MREDIFRGRYQEPLLYQAEVLVNLALVGVYCARFNLVERHRASGEAGLEQRVDQRDRAPTDLAGYFRPGAGEHTRRKLMVLLGENLPVNLVERSVVAPNTLAAEQRRFQGGKR